MKLHILQHVIFETAGTIAGWAKERGQPVSYTYLFEDGISYPALNEFDCLVILGGPMGVYEEQLFGWLKAEKAFIKQAISANKIVIGICLGSQLLAEAMGAKVYPHHIKEIGFFPVMKTTAGKQDTLFSSFPDTLTVFHWHGDTFDLPVGAIHLFSSAACFNQGYRKGNCIGFQFHPEVDANLLADMVTYEKDELVESAYVQSADEIINNDAVEKSKVYFREFLEKLAGTQP